MRLSQHEYTEPATGLSAQIRDALRRIKAYYTTASVGKPVALEYDFEVQAMFPTLASVSQGLVNPAANTLHIKTAVNFGFKQKAGAVQSLASVRDEQEKLEFFCQLLEHLIEVTSQVDPGMVNLHPQSVLRVSNSQVVLTDFLIPAANQMSANKDFGLWYLGQMSPEQVLEGQCSKASLVWQMGCLLYFMLSDAWPFHQAATLYGQVKRNIIL